MPLCVGCRPASGEARPWRLRRYRTSLCGGTDRYACASSGTTGVAVQTREVSPLMRAATRSLHAEIHRADRRDWTRRRPPSQLNRCDTWRWCCAGHCCAPRRPGPTTGGWTGRCDRQRSFGDSTRPRQTGIADTGGWIWPAHQASRSTRRPPGRWCSPGWWRAGRWCPWPTQAACTPVTSRCEAAVRVGQRVTDRTVIGELATGHPGCAAAACLHWGAMWGSASRADYVNPLGLLKSTPIRLKPLHG